MTRKTPGSLRIMLRFNAALAALAWLLFGWQAAVKQDWTLALVPLIPTGGTLMQWATMCLTYGHYPPNEAPPGPQSHTPEPPHGPVIPLHGPGVSEPCQVTSACPHWPTAPVTSAVTGWPVALLCETCGAITVLPDQWLTVALGAGQEWYGLHSTAPAP